MRRSILRTLPGLLSVVITAGLLAQPETPTRADAIGLQIGPDTSVVTAPLDADGFPNYLAALNDRFAAGVSREENFWVLMWPAIGNAERSGDEYLQSVERQLGISIPREPRVQDPSAIAGVKYGTPEGDSLENEWNEAMSRPWSRDEFPRLARWVDANAAVLEEIHAAALRPKAYAPLATYGEDDGLLVEVLLPHVQALRSTARLLATRAMLRLSEGDVDGAWQDLLDIERIAAHSERGWTLIEALVGYALRSIAVQPLAQWVAHANLTPEELEARWGVLEPLLDPLPLSNALDTERFCYLDVVIAMSSGRTQSRQTLDLLEPSMIDTGDGATSQAFAQMRSAREMMFQLLLLGSDINETLRYGNQMYDDLIAAMAPESHPERAARLAAIDDRVEGNAAMTRDTGALVKAYLFSSRKELQAIPGKVLTSLLMPAITQVEVAFTRASCYRPLLNTCFEVQKLVSSQGVVPVRPEDLPAAAPTDPFTGESVRMTADNRGLVLYSVGPNGRDDGGKTYREGPATDDVLVILPVVP